MVIRFLDECVQRCLKTPYRYIEDMYALFTATPGETPDRLDACPSPLLLTVLEQLDAKVGNKSLSPSGTLALASFLRKLMFRLTGKMVDLKGLRVVVDKVDVVLSRERLWDGNGDEVVRGAVRTEVGLMSGCLGVPPKRVFGMEGGSERVDAFLGQVEGMQIRESFLSPRIPIWFEYFYSHVKNAANQCSFRANRLASSRQSTIESLPGKEAGRSNL